MQKTDDRMFELACHEGNYAMTGIPSGTRPNEKTAEGATKKGSR
jgi:hypothetical protein